MSRPPDHPTGHGDGEPAGAPGWGAPAPSSGPTPGWGRQPGTPPADAAQPGWGAPAHGAPIPGWGAPAGGAGPPAWGAPAAGGGPSTWGGQVPGGPPVEMPPLAGWWRRMSASLLDFLVYLVFAAVLVGGGIALGEIWASSAGRTILEVRDGRDDTWGILVAILVGGLLTIPAFIGAIRVCGGRAPGKAALGLRVHRVEGPAVGFGGNVLRDVVVKWALFYWVLGQCFVPWVLDWLWPLWDDRRQALHDKLTSTVVVHERGAPTPPEAHAARPTGPSATDAFGR